MACELGGIDRERLASRARDRETAEARRLIAALRAERWGQSRRDLAPVMNKNPDVVSWWVGEGSLRRVDDLSFAGRLDGLDNKLAKSPDWREEPQEELMTQLPKS